jgi:hypothetical protein
MGRLITPTRRGLLTGAAALAAFAALPHQGHAGGLHGHGGGAGGGSATFNPADKSANITLSGGDLIATSGSANAAVRSIASHATGKYGFSWSALTGSSKVGICLATDSLTSDIAGEPGAYALFAAGDQIYHGGSGAGMPAASTPATSGVFVFDFTNHLGWVWNPALVLWNNNGSADPAAGTGGFTIASGTYFGVFGGSSTDTATFNFATPTLPSGFSAWG